MRCCKYRPVAGSRYWQFPVLIAAVMLRVLAMFRSISIRLKIVCVFRPIVTARFGTS